MANHIAASRLRRELAARNPAPAPTALPPQTFFPLFSDAEWRSSQYARELVDAVVHTHRWRVTIMPSDGHPRRFWLRGTLESVTARANAIFTAPHLVLVEPAPVQVGGEIFDRRLNNIPPGEI